ncbi:restriction endonuclease subunit S [Bacillus sp. SD075]|uniref:restriction endonuclease subunit S n=1 Tax=Bacillus sp. SD075 TaxID=2781732 RepID=UPI001A96A612|nr:restriction endonuclease subunit S [Bacillus sp. SD075]MBO0999039.1 restriction endonuclease subunit S [Bacillus sp. SD075]
MSKNEKLVPKRRFKEFKNADAWKQRKLIEVADYRNGKAHEQNIDENGEYIVVNSKFVSTNRRVKKYSNELIEPLSIGEIAFVLSDVPNGRAIARTFLVEENDKYSLNQRIAGITPHDYTDSYFLSNLMNRNRYFLQFDNGVGQTNLSKSEVENFIGTYPLYEEQAKIGSFFRNLDNLIAFQQRKLNKTKAMKSAYLSEMFPAAGERKPKRRFAGFTQAWEQRKVGELADIVRGASPRPIQDPKWFDDESDIGWLRIADVTEQEGRIHYLEQRISKAGQEKTRVLNEPHLLLSIAATVGKPVVNYVKTGVHDGFLIFQNPKFDREFMFQWLEMFRPKWQKYGQPGSQVNLNSDLVKNQEIMLPSEEEQKKIGDFFAQLDHLITLHQRKLEKLQNIKKAYLNEMFV